MVTVKLHVATSFEWGCVARTTTFCVPTPKSKFKFFAHIGYMVMSRSQFTSLFGLASNSLTVDSFGAVSTSTSGGQINFGDGYSERGNLKKIN